MDTSHNNLIGSLESHDLSHVLLVVVVGVGMSEGWSWAPPDMQWWHRAGDKCSKWPTLEKTCCAQSLRRTDLNAQPVYKQLIVVKHC